MSKEFACTGFQCTMVEDHCVNPAKGKGGGGKTLAAKVGLRVSKTICRRPLKVLIDGKHH